jgi:hypothetical protein
MAVRQELLYYTKGSPVFNVDAEYTDIPKILLFAFWCNTNRGRETRPSMHYGRHRPNLCVRKAELNVGCDVPICTPAKDGKTKTEQRFVGTRCTLLPLVNPDGKLRLQMNASVSRLGSGQCEMTR